VNSLREQVPEVFIPVRFRTAAFAIAMISALSLCASAAIAEGNFAPVAKGVEYGAFQSGGANGKIHVLRIDPAQARLGLVLASERKEENRTVSEWCRDYKLVAAINAGMYLKDFKTNVGYLRKGNYVQNKKWNRKYMSVLAFNPKVPELAPAVLVDLDTQGAGRILDRMDSYGSVVQNLRLMKGNGINVWGKSERKWSESAIGADRQGRILFIFCRTPYSMWEFNEMVKALDIGVTRMMHLEGGPIASMSVRTDALRLDLAGVFESNSTPDIDVSQQPVPNVIGVFEK
jgi:uncharacterized protein YigE (DUF2233 family)